MASHLCTYNFFKQPDNFYQKCHREEAQSTDRHCISFALEPGMDTQGHKQWGRKTSVLPQTCIHWKGKISYIKVPASIEKDKSLEPRALITRGPTKPNQTSRSRRPKDRVFQFPGVGEVGIPVSSVLAAEFQLDAQHSKIKIQLPDVRFQRQTGLGFEPGNGFAFQASPGFEI